MSRGQKKTVGQRLGLLTGGGLILGGVLGWAWSLFQAPRTAPAPPVPTPQPPEASTPEPSTATAAPAPEVVGLSEEAVEVALDAGERAVVEHTSLSSEPPPAAVEAVDPVEAADPVEAPAPPVVAQQSEPVAVPEAVKAIRAAAAAARQRLETPTRALAETPAAPEADAPEA